MHVACATDEGYAPHCATMLQSLLVRHPGIRVSLLHGPDLGAATLERLRQFVAGHASQLDPVAVPESLIAGFPDRRFHVSCWYRVLLPELLPQTPRVLYLDADVLVLQSLQPLWETDLQGRWFAAAVNPLYPFMPDRAAALGLSSPAEYLNSGVMLMDLDRMRRAGLSGHLRKYGAAHPEYPWPEQDALSVVCRGQWQPLHPRWNVQSTVFDLSPAQLPLPAAEVAEARAQPAIVHFIGPLKPWTYLCRHPLRGRYAEFRAQTPWPQFELEGRTWPNRLLRPLPLGMQLALRRRFTGPYRCVAAWWRKRRLLGPRLMRAFAAAYPDAVFVQVGANDGATPDPVRVTLPRVRWRGVMVEPVPYVFTRLQRTYGNVPGIALENVAVTADAGASTLPFHYVDEARATDGLPEWYDEIGSFRKDVLLSHADRIPHLHDRLVTAQVPCLTFEALCAKHALDRVDLVHMDTEGSDAELVGALDLERWRPLLLIYENKHLDPATRAACRTRLEIAGYTCFDEVADTWCVDTRVRDARHRGFLARWEQITA